MILALTLTFAGWWIPLVVTLLGFLFFFSVASKPSYGYGAGLDGLLAFGVFITVSLIAWLIYFIIV